MSPNHASQNVDFPKANLKLKRIALRIFGLKCPLWGTNATRIMSPNSASQNVDFPKANLTQKVDYPVVFLVSNGPPWDPNASRIM